LNGVRSIQAGQHGQQDSAASIAVYTSTRGRSARGAGLLRRGPAAGAMPFCVS
jgi:hypothetical protein